MFANIRRHQKWLWFLISGAVIISFTWYLNPSNRGGGGRGGMFQTSVGTINGRSIDRNEYQNAWSEAQLQYLFSYGTWYGSDEFSRQNEGYLERESRQRLFLKEKIKEMGIQVTAEEVANWIREALGRDKPFTEADYDRFLQTLAGHNVNEADLNRFVRDQIAIMHLAQVAGMPGKLVTPQEAEAKYRRDNQQVAADAVFFLASNYVAQVNLDPSAIAGFYSNRLAAYRVPAKVQLSYVAFPATNYLAEAEKIVGGVTNLNQALEETLKQRGPNYYTDTNGVPLAPEAAKLKIREEETQRIALTHALRKATEFAQELFDLTNQAPSSATLEAFAAAKGYVAKTTEPFAQYEAPPGLDVPERFTQLAFQLTEKEPYMQEPIKGPDAVYISAFKTNLPPRFPPLEEVRERVTEDYKRVQSETLAQQAGQAFYSKLTNSLAGGKTFSAAATELGQPIVSLAPFSQVTRAIPGLPAQVDVAAVKNAAFALKEGETSPYTMLRQGGFVLHVNKFIPVADDAVKAALPEFLATMQRSGQSEAFGEWFSKEYQLAKISLVTDPKPGQKGADSGGQSATQ